MKILKWLIPSLSDALLIVIFLSGLSPITTPDFWWHLTMGREIVKLGTIPDINIFYYTPAPNYSYNYAWLAQLLFYNLYFYCGWGSIIFLSNLLSVVTFFLLFKMLSYRKVNVFWSLLLLTVVGALSLLFWTMRPLIFTWFLFTCTLYVLDCFTSQDKNFLWLLPIIMAFWVNLHPGFLAGLGLVIIYMLFELRTHRFKKFFWATVATFGACVINPFGLKIYLLPWDVLKKIDLLTHYITEWQARVSEIALPYGIFVFLFIMSLNLSKKRLSLQNILLFGLFLVASLCMVRHTPLFTIVSIPIFADMASPIVSGRIRNFVDETTKMSSRYNNHLLLVIILTIFGIGSLTSEVKIFNPGVDLKRYPIKAIEYINQMRPPKEIFVREIWNGYFLWLLYPHYKSFFDARGEYSEEIMRDYFQILHPGPEWKEVLDKYNINCILCEPYERISILLRESENWECVYSDSIATVFVRKNRGIKNVGR